MASRFDELFDMSSDTVLITGGGTGLGRHFAQVLAGAGATVILSGRRMEKLEESAHSVRDSGGRAHCVAMDVSDSDSVARGIEACNEISPVNVLVNNAGTTSENVLLDLDEEAWDSVLDTNLKGAWMVGREVVRSLVARGQGGAIVNIASVLGTSVQKGTGGYCPSKAGLLQLTRQMALEWARFKVRVNAISPGYYHTDIAASYLDSDAGKALLRRIPARRLGEPCEMDAALLMLSSSASSYMTGSAVNVDGGLALSIV
jgi:NAD(P)-dependent dehydrogenase (short-subunit alcohol dehydrogenase family)